MSSATANGTDQSVKQCRIPPNTVKDLYSPRGKALGRLQDQAEKVLSALGCELEVSDNDIRPLFRRDATAIMKHVHPKFSVVLVRAVAWDPDLQRYIYAVTSEMLNPDNLITVREHQLVGPKFDLGAKYVVDKNWGIEAWILGVEVINGSYHYDMRFGSSKPCLSEEELTVALRQNERNDVNDGRIRR